VCVVLAARDIPTVRSGDVIHGMETASYSVSGWNKTYQEWFGTAGGRVLGVTSSGPDLAAAILQTYEGRAQSILKAPLTVTIGVRV